LLNDRAWIVRAIRVSHNLESALDLALRADEVSSVLQNQTEVAGIDRDVRVIGSVDLLIDLQSALG
jgi:hypothetical protein